MSIDNNSFDDLVRKKFEGDEEPVEPFLWDSVEKQLPVSGTKKRFAYRRLAAILLFITIPASLIYYFNEDEITKSKVVKVESDTKQESKEINVEQNASAIIETKGQPAITLQTEKSSASLTQNSAIKIPKQKNKTQNGNSIGAGISTSVLNGYVNKTEPTVSSNTSSSQSTNQTLSAIEHTTIALEQSISALQNEVVPPVAEQVNPDKEESKPEVVKPDSLIPQKTKSANWFVELFYSPDYAKKTFELNSSDANYLKLRKNTEQFIYAHSFGIRAGRKIGKNISVKTGLDFTKMQYQLTYGYFPGQVPLPAGLKIDSIVGIVIDPLNSGIITSHDTIVANYELVGTVAEINHYKLYNIPVIFSYTIGKNKMKLETGAGGFINILSRQKGSIISDDRITRINLGEDMQRTPYKTSVCGGISAEVLMTYSVRPQIKFIIGPHAKYYLGKLNKSNAPLNEKLFTAGLLTGFRVEF